MSEYRSGITESASGTYYVEQAQLYFNTLDFSSWFDTSPSYAKEVIRWEHPPWLKLTGYGRFFMTTIDKLQTLYPTYVTKKECVAADTSPQARCYVSFKYIGLTKSTDIYEEFSFNEAGEITFIEAWSDTPKVRNEVTENTIERFSQMSNNADLHTRLKHPVYYWLKELLSWF